MAEEITSLWQEAVQLLLHGAWLPARKERGIAYTTANRFIRLRQHCPQINQLGEFGTMPAALTRGRSARPRQYHRLDAPSASTHCHSSDGAS